MYMYVTNISLVSKEHKNNDEYIYLFYIFMAKVELS